MSEFSLTPKGDEQALIKAERFEDRVFYWLTASLWPAAVVFLIILLFTTT